MATKLKDANTPLELEELFLKTVPVLGTIVLVGAVIQLILGFVVAGGMDALVGVHMALGVLGLILVIALTAIAFRAKTATLYSRITIILLTLVVIAQVGLGVQLFNGADALAVSHEANGFVIIILALLMGGITFWSSKRKIKA